MKKICLFILCGVFTLTAIGCGTIKGFGDDISAVGGWFSKGSDNVKEGLKKEDVKK